MCSFNTIYGRIEIKTQLLLYFPFSLLYVLQLLCMEQNILCNEIYAVEKLCESYDSSFMTIFATYDKNNIRFCQYYCNILPMNYQIVLKTFIICMTIKNSSWLPVVKIIVLLFKNWQVGNKISNRCAWYTEKNQTEVVYNYFQTMLHGSNQL